MKLYSTAEVRAACDCEESTARKWAEKNNVQLVGNHFIWTEADIDKFKERPRPGRPWPEKKDKNNDKA